MAFLRNLALVASLWVGAGAATSGNRLGAPNPIRRVVNLLQAMQTKINEEAKHDQALHKKFMCQCRKAPADLTKSIGEGESKISQLESSIKESEASKAQLESEIEQEKQDEASAKQALAEAISIREKDTESFAAEQADQKANIAAIDRALESLRKGTGGFLQSAAAKVVGRLMVDVELSNADRDALTDFLSQAHDAGYQRGSGQIVGILTDLKRIITKNLAEVMAAEERAQRDFERTTTPKSKELSTAAKLIEQKMARHGEVSMTIVTLREDLDDTTASLEQDRKFLTDLTQNCDTRKKEFHEVRKARNEELQALSEVIKALNDDEALELFKKALPAPSLLQMQVTGKQMRSQAAEAIRPRRRLKDTRLDLIALALHGQKMSFDKIISMIDELLALLHEEQKQDNRKKTFCLQDIDRAENSIKALDLDASDIDKEIEEIKDTIVSYNDEVATMETNVKRFDQQVVKATQMRKEESALYMQELTSKGSAQELLEFAKNRLNKFYNPKLYREPPPQQNVDNVSQPELQTALVAIVPEPDAPASEAQEAQTPSELPPVPPEPPKPSDPSEPSEPEPVTLVTLLQAGSQATSKTRQEPEVDTPAFEPKKEQSTGVISMISTLIEDLKKEIQIMKFEEKDAQQAYEQFVEDSANKRAADVTSIAEKERTVADLQTQELKLASEHKSKLKEALATTQVLADRHSSCDWMLSNYDIRQESRETEINSLERGKAVLNGAFLSLVQTSHKAHQ